MPHTPLSITATGQYILDAPAVKDAGQLTFQTVGLSGTCSVIPRSRPIGTGTANMVAIPYTNVNTDTSIAAGTPITADGQYQVAADGPELILDATVTSGSVSIYQWPTAGGGGTANGGGGGGAITVANGADVALGAKGDGIATSPFSAPYTATALLKAIATALQGSGGAGSVSVIVQDPTLTFTLPTGDAIGARAIHVDVNGEIAAGSNGASLSPVVIGTLDASSNVQTLPMGLWSTTPTATLQNAIYTYGTLGVIGTGNTTRGASSAQNVADGGSGATALAVGELLWNGATWDRRQSNLSTQALGSGVHTTGNSGDLVNTSGKTVMVAIALTSGAGSVVLDIQNKDVAAGDYITLLSSASLSGTGKTLLRIGPQYPNTANVSANDFIARLWRLNWTVTGSLTFSLSYMAV